MRQSSRWSSICDKHQSTYGHWNISLVGEFNAHDWYGFLYKITDEQNKKFYIGRKAFTKKGKRGRIESDWRTYKSSCEPLKASMTHQNFTFQILKLAKNKAHLAAMETQAILESNALVRSNYFNGWVSCRIHAKHLKGEMI